MKYPILCFSFLLTHTFLFAQQFASWKENKLILDNGIVKREIVVEENKIITNGLTVKTMMESRDGAWFHLFLQKIVTTVMEQQ